MPTQDTPAGVVRAYTRPIGTSHRRVSVEANAADTLRAAGFARDTEVDIATGGQFSLVDLILAVIATTGPARVTLCTWTAAEFDLTQISNQLRNGSITDLRLIVDRSFVSRAPKFVQAVAESFGIDNIRTTYTHAKFVTITNPNWAVTIRTSMNLNHNKRIEYAQVAADPNLTHFWQNIADEIFATETGGLVNERQLNTLAGIEQIPAPTYVRTGLHPRLGQPPRIGKDTP